MYGKVFDSLFTGSMRGKGDVQLVFIYMISNASEDGIFDQTPQCIADATGKPLSTISACIATLEAPDEMSRTRTDNGRRIRRLDDERPWGWQIVNHAHYRQIANREAMKEAERLRKRDYRQKKEKQCPGQVPDKTGLPEYESDTDSASGKGEGVQGKGQWTLEDCEAAAAGIGMTKAMVQEFWQHYAAVDFIDAAGRRITNLKAALGKWNTKQQSGQIPGAGKERYRGRTDEDETEWNRAWAAIADAVWTAREREREDKGSISRAIKVCRDKWRDVPKLGDKDVVTAAVDMAMNNERPKA